jgi:PiT family inorganic phosphate transporter
MMMTLIFLVLAVGLALAFEFVNGFHDTANAVATVIYTNSLKPTAAVIWSGVWNLIGVLTSSSAVAFGVVALLPVDLLLNVGSAAGFAMVFSLLLSAIVWNLGTWYLGLPASSSHTLIGSIIGVGVANSLMGPAHSWTEGVNWGKAKEVGMGLLVSPVLGFVVAGLLLLAAKALLRDPALYRAPEGKAPPPLYIRALLIFTCTGVSFAHGSNDGQKGMGLIVLILIGILPGSYALKMSTNGASVRGLSVAATELSVSLGKESGVVGVGVAEGKTKLTTFVKGGKAVTSEVLGSLAAVLEEVGGILRKVETLKDLSDEGRVGVRQDLYLASSTIKRMEKLKQMGTDRGVKAAELAFRKSAETMTEYVPLWVKVAVALALGLGTTIGYQRIVRTVGEGIGKSHLTYAQGASAELVAMGTIMAADHFGLPVSTTHVLSSGVAGTMVANGSGLQRATVRNILLAWVLTLPVCIFLGALLFAGILNGVALMGLK